MSARPVLWLALLALCPLAGPAAAAEKRRSHRDFVFLSSDRPILIRLHLRASGRPFTEPWEKYTAKLFAYFDSDGNGVLEKKEADRIPQANFLTSHLRGSIAGYREAPVVPVKDVDTDKDGKVTLPEFRSYYRKQRFVPMRYGFSVQADAARRITDRLYKYLDEDADGLLSAAELARAPEALRKVDANEDEMIVGAELSGTGNTAGYSVAPPPVAGAAVPNAGSNPRALFRVGPGSTQPFGRWFFQQYDKDRNGRLTLAEIGLPEADAAALDTNKDGSLDVKELEGFARRKPDVELSALAGDSSKGSLAARVLRGVGLTRGPDRLAVFNPDKRPMPLAARTTRLDNSTLVFTWGDAEVEIQVSPARTYNPFGTRSFYYRQFRSLAGKEKKIDRKKAMQDFALRGVFVFADADRDDTLTEKEMLAYLDIQKSGSGCVLVVSAADRGRSLLEALDADRDERLSSRELLEGWRRLRPDPKDTRGFDRGEMSRHIRVVIGQGQANYRRVVPPKKGGLFAVGPPTWFTHMDRNGDGDVSPREFLGSEADFRKLDADDDGLLSAEEARKGKKAVGR
jgi:Ca2+-binding EF-hand superfamily protein